MTGHDERRREADAERALVGVCLFDGAAFKSVEDIVSPEHLVEARNRAIYTACASVAARGETPDLVLVAAELEERGELTAAGGREYLVELVNETLSSSNVAAYARAVRAAAERIAVPERSGRASGPLKVVVLDAAAYTGLAGEIVSVIEPHTEADPAALLLQLLVAFGSIVGRRPHYLVESSKHHTNLYVVLVGRSSKARKGTSWDRTRALFAQIDDPWARECLQGGLSSGEGLLHAVRDGDDEDDPGVSDKRLCIIESEYAGLLRVMTREGNIISRICRDAWDRGDLRTMTRSCPLRATGAHVSIVGHITADELVRYLDRTEAANGFANRFLFAQVRRSKHLPHGGSLSDRDLLPLSRALAAAVGKAREIDRVQMDADTRVAWETVYESLAVERGGMFGAITARAEAQTIRLALIYALLDGAAQIQLQHLEAALAVWSYCEESAREIFGDRTGNALADRILDALRAATEPLSRTAISAVLGRHAGREQIELALDLLRQSGMARSSSVPTGGRSVERWEAL